VSKVKSDPSQYGLVQIGVYLTLLWSGERNFAVRLNKVGGLVCRVASFSSFSPSFVSLIRKRDSHSRPRPASKIYLHPQEYEAAIAIEDVPFKSGTHGDLLVLFIHSLLTTKNANFSALYECLLTVIVNISPYLKSLSLLASNKLMHLVQVGRWDFVSFLSFFSFSSFYPSPRSRS
jgi:hypothetical protein